MAAADRIAAAIDIGSNTVHMLAARWSDGQLEPLDEESTLVGLAEDVYATGALSPGRICAAAEAVAALAGRARNRGAVAVLLVATAAVRDAANAEDLVAAVRERAGLDLRLIDGRREAELTFLGASSGEDVARLQVCDVGGGSTEVIRSKRGQLLLATSLPIGSSRLSRGFAADPPSAQDIESAYATAVEALSALEPWRPRRLAVTGGTATALMQVAGRSGRRSVVTANELAGLRALVAAEPSSSIASRYGVEPKRARLLPAGAAIIAATQAVAQVPEVVLTAAGLRDGLLIAHFRG